LAKNVSVSTVTIASSATTSTALTLEANRVPVAIQTPASLTGTAMTFEASTDEGATYTPVYDESTLYSITVGTSRFIGLKRVPFEGVKLVRLVSGSSEGGARSIKIISGE